MSSRGLFITVEGIDGCGKSTQARLIAAALEAAGHDVLRLREPGGVKISEQIREILLDPANVEMGDVCELLLYEAARAQLVHQVIRPALAAGKTVVCDRFYDSTTAYQAFADGLDRNMVSQANELAVDGCRPDLTLVFDLPVEDALRRRSGREAEDRLELKGLEFQERVAAGFRAVAVDEPDRVKLIDAGGSIAEVFSGVAAELRSAGLSMSEDDVAAALQACQGKC
ncbi:dTMP kinase [Collinsella intestinalis DSM 13280]|uniref:Thymidylate kinase n=1 Tax=Collinsella intestinalis DSM 13280 TaxID=521003 RepID=C4FBK9_9ACTN|nr:dTMP kinase [Collinsella intestinalis]EEP43761.1 dTMP kinase [Collinsella intestinalis DSM 13280]